MTFGHPHRQVSAALYITETAKHDGFILQPVTASPRPSDVH